MARVQEIGILHDTLMGVAPGAPVAFGGLTVVPLVRHGAADPAWSTLDEALASQVLEAAEVTEGGAVPFIQVVNRGGEAVLLLDGEEMVGAKQDRILNTSILVAAGVSLRIPVSCVEQGRWGYRSRRFGSAGRTLYASLRSQKAAQVYASLSTGHGHAANQGDIWSALHEKARAYGVESRTAAMGDVFEARSDRLAEYGRTLAPVEGQVGAIMYGARAWWGLELLAGPALFGKAWPRLLSGYAMDALAVEAKEGTPEEPALRLQALLAAEVEAFPAVGSGEDYRFRGPGLVGAALVAEGRVAHLMAFPG